MILVKTQKTGRRTILSEINAQNRKKYVKHLSRVRSGKESKI